MTIDEAIARLAEEVSWLERASCLDRAAAIKLGIEALKRMPALRAIYEKTSPQLLPGETEK